MGASPVVKQWRTHLPMQKTQTGSLGREDPQEEEMATHSSIAWRIPWTEEPGGLQSCEVAESDTIERVINNKPL